MVVFTGSSLAEAPLVIEQSCPTLSQDCSSPLNSRPVIGVLAQDYYGNVAGKQSFIAASYVKWLESGGARVMPVFVNQSEEYYDEVLNLVNGLLFPGRES